MPVGGAIAMDRNTRQIGPIQGRAALNVWSAHCQGLRRRQHRTEHKGHTPNPRIGIKIPHPAGNLTLADGMEGMDSTDHATATDFFYRTEREHFYSGLGLEPGSLAFRAAALTN